MSLTRVIFARIWNSASAKARKSEELGGRMIENFRVLRRITFYFGVVYASGSLFRYFVIDWGASEGPSMFPTIPTKTPISLFSNLHVHGKNMRVGDIVQYASPIFRDEHAGKRIVGMPGDYVVHDANAMPSVGGAPVPGITDWRSHDEIERGVELKERAEPMMIEVPEGHIYATGDNLAWSRDSRFYGPVPMALIRAKQISHCNGGVTNWSWTAGEQLRRIPKEEEEEYLRGWKQKKLEQEAVAATTIKTTSAGKVD